MWIKDYIFRFIKYSVLSSKFYLSNIYPIHHVVLNIQIDTILEYIIKFKVKQIMSKDDFIQEMIYKYVIRGSLNQWCRKKPISNKSSMAQWTKYNVLSEMGTSQYAWLNLKISKTRPYEHFRDTYVNLYGFLINFLV